MRKFMNILEGVDHPFETGVPAEDLVDDVREAKLLTGEDFPGSDDELIAEIKRAQRTLSRVVSGRVSIPIYRAIAVDTQWIETLAAGAELGDCWSWGKDGAFAYNAPSGKAVVRMSANVEVTDIDWITTIALVSAEEFEVRVHLGSPLLLTDLEITSDRYGTKFSSIRPDLVGSEMYA